ncbi:unnamed protein product [Closterium sp. NIES-54]
MTCPSRRGRSDVGTRDQPQRVLVVSHGSTILPYLPVDFTYSSPQATPLSTRHSLSALPSDESVEPSGPYPELVGCLMYPMTCTRPDLPYPLSILARYVAPGRHRPEHMAAAKRVLRYLCSTSGLGLVLGGRRPVVLTGHADASWADDQATQRSSQGYTFSLGSGSVSWRSTRSSSVLGSSCEAEIYAGAMAAQELRWLTYLLTDLGEQPRSPPVLYVDNKAMLALCREHRLEHRTKHIALRYFLARELQQRGQLCLAYVASQANTADIFTKALPPGDHQRFCFPTFLKDPKGFSQPNTVSYATWFEADWDEQNVDNASEEAGPLPYCSVPIPMDDENPRESVNAETYFDFADTGYVTPQPVDTNISERIGPNFLPDPEAGDEAAYPEDTNLPCYTQSGLQILRLVIAKPPAELFLKWIDEAWADVPEEMVRKAFLTCGISNAEDGSLDHLILAHMRDSGEVEVLEDVMEEEQDELVPNLFYPAPVVTPPDVTVEMEEEVVLAAEAEEADEEAVPTKSDSSESDNGNANEADEWSDEGDEWWAPGRYEGAEIEEWVAGDEDE